MGVDETLRRWAQEDVATMDKEVLGEYAGLLRKQIGLFVRRYKALRERLTEVEQEAERRNGA